MRLTKMMLAASAAVTAIALMAPVTGWAAKTETIYNPEPIKAPCNKLTNDKVRTAVRETFLGRGWLPTDKGPNAVEAKLEKSKYNAVVTATWTTQAVTIKYKSSEGLRAEGDQIHRNYNKWIRYLERDLSLKLSQACG